ncbi:GumC family protein [Teredinibacter purpureus]|uniref:GumC family protein n=1 Tax=Teredinibacter purpureus TaxID=2731756 RepID=UPI0005F7C1AA|nr:hypothetical protein [Teredinibacter purpureus]
MNTLPVPIDTSHYVRRAIWRLRSFRYVWVALLSILGIVGLVFFYLSRPPVYSSVLSIVLPGSGSSSSFNIDNVGAANQVTNTPFSSVAFSPLVNYKEILKSREVMSSVADRLGVRFEDVAKPRVELRERTSILFIHVPSGSPERAQEYGWAIYDSFQESLDRLRQDELFRRDNSVRAALEQYRLRLAQTRSAIVEFQQRSLLVSSDQVAQLMNTITTVNEKILSSRSLARNTEDFVRQLGIDLGVSPSLAGQAFRLQSDPEFKGYLQELDASAMKAAEYSSLWGEKHPKVVAQKARFEGAKSSLLHRSKIIVGEQAGDLLHSMNLQNSVHRADLFASLMDSYAKLQGSQAEINELSQAEAKLRDRLKVYTRESAELERLEREHSLAEAVFTSAAARLEAGKADIFASYPAVQILSVPSLPSKPKSPSKVIAMAVGVLGVVFILFGLITAWHRQYLIDLLLKNS